MRWHDLEELKLPTEKDIQRKLHSQLGGRIEVKLPNNRRIDLLTNTQLIEIKKAKSWGLAVEQVMNYGQYYPFHQKRIHLFGLALVLNPRNTFDLATETCNRLNIIITWEA